MPTLTSATRLDQSLQLLERLLADDTISDILINRPDSVYFEQKSQMRDSGIRFESVEAVKELAEEIIRRCAQESGAPIIDGMLPGGSRVNVVLPPIAVGCPSISIRKFPASTLALGNLTEYRFLSRHMEEFLKLATQARLNIIVSGNTSSGKTTLLNALSAHIAPLERVVTIEDTPELQIQLKNVVRMSTLNALHTQKTDIISARDLVKTSLRMRPDRIIMGEVRGSEAYDLLQIMNTGHDGSMATLHANSPRDALMRLENMISQADINLPHRAIRQQIVSSVNLIVQTDRDESGHRRITHITSPIGMEGEVIVLQDLFIHDPKSAANGGFTAPNVTARHPKLQKVLTEAKAGVFAG